MNIVDIINLMKNIDVMDFKPKKNVKRKILGV